MSLYCLTGPLRVGKSFLLEQLARHRALHIPRWHSVKPVRNLFVEQITPAALAVNVTADCYELIDSDLYGTYFLPRTSLRSDSITLVVMSLEAALRWRKERAVQIIYILPDPDYRRRTTNKAWKDHRDHPLTKSQLAQTTYQLELTNPTNKTVWELESILFDR